MRFLSKVLELLTVRMQKIYFFFFFLKKIDINVVFCYFINDVSIASCSVWIDTTDIIVKASIWENNLLLVGGSKTEKKLIMHLLNTHLSWFTWWRSILNHYASIPLRPPHQLFHFFFPFIALIYVELSHHSCAWSKEKHNARTTAPTPHFLSNSCSYIWLNNSSLLTITKKGGSIGKRVMVCVVEVKVALKHF